MKPDRFCALTDCPRDVYADGLCRQHWVAGGPDRRPLAPQATVPTSETDADLDDLEPLQPLVVYCPNDLLGLVAACVDNDAKAILRLIWPHFLEARLAGVEAFTLAPAS